MTLKITMTLDEEAGEELIGLLGKALGRGELGIKTLQIEARDDGLVKKVKLQELPVKRKGFSLGMRAIKTGRTNGTLITLQGIKTKVTLVGIKRLWEAAQLSPNGVSATLSKLTHRGLIHRVSKGHWRLLPKGEELLATWENRTNEGERVSSDS